VFLKAVAEQLRVTTNNIKDMRDKNTKLSKHFHILTIFRPKNFRTFGLL
jgi:hypothetical protein